MNRMQFINGVPVILLTAGLARAMPGWEQVNGNGFGDPQTGEVTALEEFNGDLYAGTYNPIDPGRLYDGAQIFRSPDGVTWTGMIFVPSKRVPAGRRCLLRPAARMSTWMAMPTEISRTSGLSSDA